MGKAKKTKGSRISHPYVAKQQINNDSTNEAQNADKKIVKKDPVKCIKNELKTKTKKGKMKEKSQKWKEKLENIKKAKEEEKEKAKRQKTKITGDMKPLSDELTSIFTSIMADKKINLTLNPTNKPNNTPYNPFLSNVEHFRSVLSNKNFQENPLSAVKAHILRTNAMHKT